VCYSEDKNLFPASMWNNKACFTYSSATCRRNHGWCSSRRHSTCRSHARTPRTPPPARASPAASARPASTWRSSPKCRQSTDILLHVSKYGVNILWKIALKDVKCINTGQIYFYPIDAGRDRTLSSLLKADKDVGSVLRVLHARRLDREGHEVHLVLWVDGHQPPALTVALAVSFRPAQTWHTNLGQ